MKKLFFATVMCLATLATKAQVLTAETISDVYEQAMNGTEGDFAYNVERNADGRIATAFVYERRWGRRGAVSLKPRYQYDYAYDADGLLLSRTTRRWHQGQWVCTGRLDYTTTTGAYSVEYSRWNPRKGSFDEPLDKTTYTLLPDTSVNHVYTYHRAAGSQPYQLAWLVAVNNLPLLRDELLTQQR